MKYLIISALLFAGCGSESSSSSSDGAIISEEPIKVEVEAGSTGETVTVNLDGRYMSDCEDSSPLSFKHNLKIAGDTMHLETIIYEFSGCIGDRVLQYEVSRGGFEIIGKSEEFTNGYKFPFQKSSSETLKVLNDDYVDLLNFDNAYGISDWVKGVARDVRDKNYDPNEAYERPEARGNVIKVNVDGSIQLGDVEGALDQDDYPVTLGNIKFIKQ